jgi:hypothetical protein
MSTLLYDSNLDTKMSRQGLRHLKTPDPMGPRHHPYPFSDFADNTVNAIERAGYTVKEEDFAVQKDGMRMFGLLKVSNAPTHIPLQSLSVPTSENVPAIYKPKWDLLVGVRGANDQSIARGLVVGTQIMVCSNLCFDGNLGVWKRKQTTNIESEMPDIIGHAVSQLDRKQEEFTIDFDAFNRIQISRDDGDRILLDILRDDQDSLSASQFERAIAHWDELPQEVEEHAANGRNLWWLFNACTHGLKPTGANSNHSDKADQSATIYKHLKLAVSNHASAGRVRLLN